MPTIFRFDALRIVIYPNDHRPAHVHVRSAEGEAVFILNCPNGPPALRESYGFNLPSLSRIEDMIAGKLTDLCREWSKYHGNF